jgi:hypothetical protein
VVGFILERTTSHKSGMCDDEAFCSKIDLARSCHDGNVEHEELLAI